MRIYVISDTHANNRSIILALSELGKADYIFHLGDYVEDGEKIMKALGINTIIVRGNGDWANQKYADEEIIELKGHKFYLTHGHLYDVSHRLDKLYYRAEELEADFALFGHTHVPLEIKEKGITILNPGSPSKPRGRSRKIGSFIELKIDKEVKIIFHEMEI